VKKEENKTFACEILLWTKVALGQVFSENFGFPCQSTFHLFLHNHLHYHPRLAQSARSGSSSNSLTNQIKKKLLLILKVEYFKPQFYEPLINEVLLS
jgi:hypothetical protein